MSVLSCIEGQPSGLQGDGIDRVFTVLISPEHANGCFEARSDYRIPRKNTRHPYSSKYYADDISSVPLRPDSGSGLYVVTVKYKLRQENEATAADEPQLNDEETRTQWVKSPIEKPMEYDIDGIPVLNSAGEPFDPPPVTTINERVYVVTRNESRRFFSHKRMEEYGDGAVNSDEFFGRAPGTAKIEIEATERRNDLWGVYYRVTYRVHFRRPAPDEDGAARAWQRRLLDQGYRYVKDGKIYMATDENGNPVSQPVLLDGNGGLLSESGLSSDEQRKGRWLYFKDLPVLPFSVFELPKPPEDANV